MPVPIIDFKNVPVSASVAKPVQADDVRKAFLRAAALQHWVLTPMSEGVMEARFVKNNKHTVVATVTYDAERYSIAYKSSIDMKYEENAFQSRPLEQAAQKQKDQFASDPLTPFAVLHQSGAVLHPFYETWVRQLLGGVSAELKAAS